jgi:hypothetical protein
MEYLSVDFGKPKPLSEPYGKTFWSPSPEQATPFGSQGEADSWKKSTSDATGVAEIDDKWYVDKERSALSGFALFTSPLKACLALRSAPLRPRWVFGDEITEPRLNIGQSDL